MTTVIAVMAPVGGGKTTLATALAWALPEASAVHFDDYPMSALDGGARDIRAWLAAGADPDAFVVPGLPGELARLVRRDPGGAARRFVLFETPFGRGHRATGRFIDLVLWLDVPYDVALSRKIRQFAGEALAAEPGASGGWARWLDAYLANYLDAVGPAIRLQGDRARADAEIVIPGDLTIDETTELARRAIVERAG